MISKLDHGPDVFIASLTGVRAHFKSFVLNCLYFTGILWILAALRLRRSAVVLMYHRVLPESLQAQSFSAPSITVTPQTFERQIRFISRFLRPVRIEEFVALLGSRRRIPSRTCLVTFDDGWYDNVEFALPILQQHEVPAVVFVATDFVDTGRCFWQERVCRHLFESRTGPEAVSRFARLGLEEIPMLQPDDARKAIREFVTALKNQPQSEIDSVLSSVFDGSQGCATTGEDRFLSWKEVRRLFASGLISIGSHAMSHTPLTQLSASAVKEELQESLRAIQVSVGNGVSVLAYPNGDADSVVRALARDAGYAAAFTTQRGLVSGNADRHLLPRINIHELATRSPAAFLGRIAGLF